VRIEKLFAKIDAKLNQGKAVGAVVLSEPEEISRLVEGLFAQDAGTQLECARSLRRAGAARPHLLYPHFNSLVDLLENADAELHAEISNLLSLIASVDFLDKVAYLLEEHALDETALSQPL